MMKKSKIYKSTWCEQQKDEMIKDPEKMWELLMLAHQEGFQLTERVRELEEFVAWVLNCKKNFQKCTYNTCLDCHQDKARALLGGPTPPSTLKDKNK